MKHGTVVRRMFFLLLIVSAVMFTGCAGMEFAPKHAIWYYHKELPEADKAIAAAQASGKDKECPEEFNAAVKMRDGAYDTYWQCHTQEGIEMAKKATEMAKNLCPSKPLPAPTPPPVMPEVKKEEPAKEIVVIKIVNFDFDKYNIEKKYIPELEMAAGIIKKYPDATIVIDGHTDSVGTATYNMRLSLRRSNSVKDYLVRKGIDAGRIKVEGYGYSRPVATNKTAAGRAQNRRAEIHIMSK